MDSDPGILGSREESLAVSLVYIAGFTYIVTLGLVQVLIPLYALHLGLPLVDLGILVASQAIFGLTLRLFAGAVADRFSERWVLWFSFISMVIGAAMFGSSSAFWLLIAGQLFIGYSRATYWTASQSYASRINPRRTGEIVGRINASGNVGQLAGTVASGLLAVLFGYAIAFYVTAAFAGIGLLGALFLPELPRKANIGGLRQSLKPVPSLLSSPGIVMAGIGGFLASSMVALTAVLLIPYLRETGYSEAMVGYLGATVQGGSVIVGIVFGTLLARLGQRLLYGMALAMLGTGLIMVPIGQPVFIILIPVLLGLGIGRGSVGILYVVTGSANSIPEQRGIALGVIGLYWGTAQLVMPLALGSLASEIGLIESFYVAGAAYLVAAVVVAVIYPKLTRGSRLANER